MGLASNRDYVKENATTQSAISTGVGASTNARLRQSCRGIDGKLEWSGFNPQTTAKGSNAPRGQHAVDPPLAMVPGRLPKYLLKRRAEIKDATQRQQDQLMHSADSASKNPDGTIVRGLYGESFTSLTEEELIELRATLKEKLAQTNKQFHAMGFSLQTPSQFKRKEQLEIRMKDLEAAITKLSRPRVLVRPA